MTISHCYWHLVVKNDNFTLVLTSTSQEWQYHIAMVIYWSGMAISHCYWHLQVKNGFNFTSWSSYWHLVVKNKISHCYWHLLVKNDNIKLLLTSTSQEWQYHIAMVIYWSGMAISHCYWHLQWRIVNFTMHCYWRKKISSIGKECQFEIATDI